MDPSETYSRRRVLGATAVASTLPAISMSAGVAGAQQDAYDGYLEDDENFDGQTRDGTGLDSVEVIVGAQGNDGPNAYDPSAVLVDPGTTVEWLWTGDGAHDVSHEEGEFQSDMTAEEDFTFEHTFEEEGVYKYFCTPHIGLGMKGVIVVGEDNVETELVELDFVDDIGLNTSAIWAGAGVFGAVAVAGVAAYRELVDSDDE